MCEITCANYYFIYAIVLELFIYYNFGAVYCNLLYDSKYNFKFKRNDKKLIASHYLQ